MYPVLVVKSLLSRVIFGIGMLMCMQIPEFIKQFAFALKGYVLALEEQVLEMQNIALRFSYTNAQALLLEHQQNAQDSVREIATSQLVVLSKYQILEPLSANFFDLNVFLQAWHIFQPQLRPILDLVIKEFQWGIPLTSMALVFGITGGLVLSYSVDLIVFSAGYFLKKNKRSTNKTV